jgi:hypothetical protein
MSLTEFHGLPLHVLLVHFVVVLVPLTALALVVCSVWPPAARRLGLVLPLLALVTLAFVPVTTHAGEWLKDRLPRNELIRDHAERGDGVLVWAIGLLVMSAAVWWLARRATAAAGTAGTAAAQPAESGATASRGPLVLRVAVAVLSVAVAVGGVVSVYRAGDSGAKAAWHGVATQGGTSGGSGEEDGDGDGR